MRKEHQFHLGTLLIDFPVPRLLQRVLQAERPHQMLYREFKQALADAQVKEVVARGKVHLRTLAERPLENEALEGEECRQLLASYKAASVRAAATA